MEATNQPISSMCFKAGNEDLVYASAGNEILSFDVRMGPQAEPLETYKYNRDEINQIAVSSKGFLAAADDSGDVKDHLKCRMEVQLFFLAKTLSQ
ncbi:hypothetical protein E2562_000548 [Oryza meyeriana var. granulata]|uniref:Uncharacterized protein n=1 Tax=Oryza meyeriana var. granulata TaxID=110450 RepID=A0A6G1DUX2_9ORYZ|nr:hypothetical protein E2562_000548 [Oryza meyeriana var. granulata]